ncbi:MAG: cell envelope integrity protein TolA, partial [Deltaproteobacteria bacterium]
LAREKVEADRLAKIKADADKRAREAAEKERIAKLKAEQQAAETARIQALKRKKPLPGTILQFGNTDFPTMVSSYNVQGNTGTRILDKETSEYVTSQYIYSQAFTVKDAMTLDKISLAMRKFGGDGSIYVDVVMDDHGKPGLPGKVEGIRSNFIDLEKVTRKPGYYWVDFSLPAKFNLKPGKYWIVFRSSGEAIMNWFYIPGKPYSEGDDTRSTAKGFQWEDILNYDFVFKVSGKAL